MLWIFWVGDHRERLRNIATTNGAPLEPHESAPSGVGRDRPGCRARGVHIFDIVVTLGDFDAVLVLGAPDNAAVAKFVDGLEGWRTVALLATSHSRYKLSNASHRESRTAV
jgi:hypothetical protein